MRSPVAAPSRATPFATVDPNTGIVLVPDPRLEVLADLFKAKKPGNCTLEVQDIADLLDGAMTFTIGKKAYF